jgi:hypothetical protein
MNDEMDLLLHNLRTGGVSHDDWTVATEAADEIERLRVIAAAAVRSVSNPAWAGVCDEDVDLERVLREAGLMGGKTK